jgi:hypothetical protein
MLSDAKLSNLDARQLISSIFEEKQAEVWELDCNDIVPKAFATESFLEKVHQFLRVKYFSQIYTSQIYISQAEYMNTNTGY